MAVDPNDLMTWLGNYMTEVMRPYEFALDKLNTEQMALKARLETLESHVESISHAPAIESDVPHFQRPNGGR